MKKAILLSFILSVLPLIAGESASFQSFTGQITRNKVRLRTQPTLDAPIAKELNRGDLLVVLSEADNFYVIQPSKDTKAYVFRTFVLDNVVEGSRVNVRLSPELEAPVIAQLNSGDRVDGVILPSNNKWLQIAPPATTRFYIAKEYVRKIGDAALLGTINQTLADALRVGQEELQKSFDEIKLEGVNAKLNKIVTDYADAPEQVNQAKALLKTFQEKYAEKKLAKADATEPVVAEVSNWGPAEESLYTVWKAGEPQGTLEAFYMKERESAIHLKGVVDVYNNSVRNKPGDYVLVSGATRVPVAFLYSTKVNLQEKIGQEITVLVSPRENNNFAFPAYHVLAIE